MKLLKLCVDMFEKESELLPNFRHMLAKKRISYGKKDRAFLIYLICWLGGRNYNSFLDYSLLAIKINHIFKNMKGINKNSWYGNNGDDTGDIKDLINKLLYDDRHDLHQNMPYLLGRIYDLMREGPDKDSFWNYMVNAVIDCINTNGTRDVSTSFIVSED